MTSVCLCVLCASCSGVLVSGKKARERERKWLKMFQNWDEWMAKKRPKVYLFSVAPGKCQQTNG